MPSATVFTYGQNVLTINAQDNDDVQLRLNNLNARIHQANGEVGTRGTDFGIFIAPEYYFRLKEYRALNLDENSQKLRYSDDVELNKYRTYSKAQHDKVIASLKAVSKACPKLLIVPGTIFWLEEISSLGPFRAAAKKAHNTAPIFFNGKSFIYHKQKDAAEISRQEREMGIKFDQGDRDGTFSFSGIPNVQFGVEICADHNNEVLKTTCAAHPVDVQLLTSCGATPLTQGLAVRQGGYVVHADGACMNSMQIWRKGVYQLGLGGLAEIAAKTHFDTDYSSVYEIQI